jgi:hypothetical protein
VNRLKEAVKIPVKAITPTVKFIIKEFKPKKVRIDKSGAVEFYFVDKEF